MSERWGRFRGLAVLMSASALLFTTACASKSGGAPGRIDGDGDAGGDGSTFDGGSSDSSVDAAGDSMTATNDTVTLSGRVLAPTGSFPISGALVYLTRVDPSPIPSGAYEYECDDMAGKPYTLSAADGTWTITDVPVGDWRLVTRKGNFRRIRPLNVNKAMDPNIAEVMTTLPSASTQDGADTIPTFAVVKTSPDLTYNLLGKFGLGSMDGSGDLMEGTENFDIYDDGGGASYPDTGALFDPGVLESYQMVFLPCDSSAEGIAFANSQVQRLRDYVAMGGRVYNSCTVSLWTEAAFPEYIDYFGADDPTRWDIGRRSNSAYTTKGRVLNTDMAAWLDVVTPEDPNSVPFNNGYVTIDSTVEVDDGHGSMKDNGVVRPYTWVQDVDAYAGSPLIVTYNFDAGKVFYSVYETSEGTADLTPQEFVLLYVILEVGVCDNLPPLI